MTTKALPTVSFTDLHPTDQLRLAMFALDSALDPVLAQIGVHVDCDPSALDVEIAQVEEMPAPARLQLAINLLQSGYRGA